MEVMTGQDDVGRSKPAIIQPTVGAILTPSGNTSTSEAEQGTITLELNEFESDGVKQYYFLLVGLATDETQIKGFLRVEVQG